MIVGRKQDSVESYIMEPNKKGKPMWTQADFWKQPDQSGKLR